MCDDNRDEITVPEQLEHSETKAFYHQCFGEKKYETFAYLITDIKACTPVNTVIFVKLQYFLHVFNTIMEIVCRNWVDTSHDGY